MMIYTHIAFASLCALAVTKYLPVEKRIVFLIIAAAAAVIVDLDHVASWAGKRLEPLSVTIKTFFGHRGFFHSIFMAAIAYLVALLISREYALAAFVGYASHIFIDCFNTAGVMLFSPLSKFRIKGPLRSGGIIEHIILIPLIAGILYFLL